MLERADARMHSPPSPRIRSELATGHTNEDTSTYIRRQGYTGAPIQCNACIRTTTELPTPLFGPEGNAVRGRYPAV